MTNKERFVQSVARFQNLKSSLETRNNLLEKAFGEDTEIIEYRGLDEMLLTLWDMCCVMFSDIPEDVLKDEIEWFLYEAVNLSDDESKYIEINNVKYMVRNSEEFYNYLYLYNNDFVED